MKCLIIICHILGVVFGNPTGVLFNHGSPIRLITPFHYQIANDQQYYTQRGEDHFKDKEILNINPVNQMKLLQENTNEENSFLNSNIEVPGTKQSGFKNIAATTKNVPTPVTSFSDLLFDTNEKKHSNQELKSVHEKISTEESTTVKQKEDLSVKTQETFQGPAQNRNIIPVFQPYLFNNYYQNPLRSVPLFYNSVPHYVQNPIFGPQVQQEHRHPIDPYSYVYNAQHDSNLESKIHDGLPNHDVVYVNKDEQDQNLKYNNEELNNFQVVLSSTPKSLFSDASIDTSTTGKENRLYTIV